ncbi:lactose-binding lectin l-2-like [Macrobrachium nipponense]|uniref:lactose-binding lectin l-2-like n=1 Tax=Macrobrachium nipponense TaxID=159736 RepID=UPI0030C7C60E
MRNLPVPLGFLLTTLTTELGLCPDGFVSFYDPQVSMYVCIMFAMDMKRTWYEAKELCESHGGDLAYLDIGYLHYEVIDYILQQPAWRDEGFHIGCSDELEEGNWVHTDGRKVDIKTSHWLPGEPDGCTMDNYCCLYPPHFLYKSCVNDQRLYAMCMI